MISSQTRENIKWSIGVAFTVAAILGVAHLIEDPAADKRNPASVSKSEKELKVFGSKPDAHTMNKGGGPVEITIHSKAKGELEAVVTASMDVENLKFAWNLPEGVSAPGGAAEGTIGAMKAGESKVLNFTFSSSTEENRQIHLNVFHMVDGEAHGQVAQYNTVNQDVIDAEVASKAEMFKQQQAQGTQEKIYQ